MSTHHHSSSFLITLMVCVAVVTPAIHNHPRPYYRPQPDFTPLISLFQANPGKAIPLINYLFGGTSATPYYPTSQQQPQPVFSYQQPAQQVMPPFSSVLAGSQQQQQPTYSYTGTLGNIGGMPMGLGPPLINNFGTYSYMVPNNNFQSYLYDPYQQIQPQQQQQRPPFGYIEKQSRNPIENPVDFVSKPPPKAMMTTAADALGLGIDFGGDEKRQAAVELKQDEEPMVPQQRRKPASATMSFNHFYNTENNDFKFQGSQQKYPGSRKISSKKGLASQQAKSRKNNSTEAEKSSSSASKNYISEPVLPPSILSLSTRWSDKDFDNFLNREQPRNIIRDSAMLKSSNEEQDPESNEQDHEIQLDVDKIMDGETQVKRSYHCPKSSDFTESTASPEVFADPVKCDQFYYCKWGKPYVFKCPMNTHFNPLLKACEEDTDFACALTLKK